MRIRAILTAALVIGAAGPAGAVEELPKQLEGVTVAEKLGQQVALDTTFTDHRGRTVKLREFFDGQRPVLLTINYYRCPTLCGIQLNALTRALKELKWTAGENFRLVTISMDHREKHSLAQKKRANYLKLLDRGQDVDWTYMVGTKDQIKKLADSVGFGYRYEPKLDQWAHPALATFVSPSGTISRYLYGLEYNARDIKFALMEASEGKVGSTVDKLILSCFHYDADAGRYGPFAFGIMRLGGALTLVLLGGFLAVLWRRDKKRAKES